MTACTEATRFITLLVIASVGVACSGAHPPLQPPPAPVDAGHVTPDAGHVVSNVGGACQSSADCRTIGGTATCLTQAAAASLGLSAPGGYCTSMTCDTAMPQTTCGPGTTCGILNGAEGSASCESACASSSECRLGYACVAEGCVPPAGGVDGGSGSNCGGSSQPCCTTGGCNPGLVCMSGTCVMPNTDVAAQPCQSDSDCASGVCLPVGQPTNTDAGWTGSVCTTACTSSSQCIPGWTCAALSGVSEEVCQCHYSPEICDGKDNDCNGIVDDEPQVNDWCSEEADGGPVVCQNGACHCTGSMCGTRCVDLDTDPDNCGACGTPCPASASCGSGQCFCPGADQVCLNACVDIASDNNNCGGCGTLCSNGTCESGSCVVMAGDSYQACSESMPCASGSDCFKFPSGSSVCLINCDPGGSGCPSGYSCEYTDMLEPVCAQGCTDSSGCPSGMTCQSLLGSKACGP